VAHLGTIGYGFRFKRAAQSNVALATAIADTGRQLASGLSGGGCFTTAVASRAKEAVTSASEPVAIGWDALDNAIKQTDTAVAKAQSLMVDCQKLLGAAGLPQVTSECPGAAATRCRRPKKEGGARNVPRAPGAAAAIRCGRRTT
jgi:hypothetical protein